MTTLSGVDVSNNNGTINWSAVAASGVQFALIKASDGYHNADGSLYTDLYFPANWAGCHDNQIARGAYHFARPDLNTAEVEAAFFVAIVKPVLQPGDVVALDLEAGVGDLSAWVLAWLTAVENAVGFKPLLYTNLPIITGQGLANNATLAQYGLWLAYWSPNRPQAPAAWPFIAVWQSSASGFVPGITGNVDVDSFNGTADQFRAYGLPQPAPTPPIPPVPDPPTPTPPAPGSVRVAVAQIGSELVSAALDPGVSDDDALADADTAERQLYTLLYQAGLRKARKG